LVPGFPCGGLEIDLPSGLEVFEAFARADGSTGWTVMIGAEAVMLLALLPRHRFDALYADRPDLIGAGSFTPRGEAKVIDGGFEVTGRWPFASGCLHSKWLLANCVVTDNGHARPGPAPDVPETRFVVFRTEQAQILDTWFVSGLRGTGSNDIAVERIHVGYDDTFDRFSGVPSVPGPLYIAATPQFSFHVASGRLGHSPTCGRRHYRTCRQSKASPVRCSYIGRYSRVSARSRSHRDQPQSGPCPAQKRDGMLLGRAERRPNTNSG
jgi:indole-3-acetate monooxygenase